MAILADPALPRSPDGLLLLCHRCQHRAAMHGGLTRLLIDQIEAPHKLNFRQGRIKPETS